MIKKLNFGMSAEDRDSAKAEIDKKFESDKWADKLTAAACDAVPLSPEDINKIIKKFHWDYLDYKEARNRWNTTNPNNKKKIMPEQRWSILQECLNVFGNKGNNWTVYQTNAYGTNNSTRGLTVASTSSKVADDFAYKYGGEVTGTIDKYDGVSEGFAKGCSIYNNSTDNVLKYKKVENIDEVEQFMNWSKDKKLSLRMSNPKKYEYLNAEAAKRRKKSDEEDYKTFVKQQNDLKNATKAELETYLDSLNSRIERLKEKGDKSGYTTVIDVTRKKLLQEVKKVENMIDNNDSKWKDNRKYLDNLDKNKPNTPKSTKIKSKPIPWTHEPDSEDGLFSLKNLTARIARVNNFACTGKWTCPECGKEMKGKECECGFSCE